MLLTSASGNPNGAEVLFFVDGTSADWSGADVASAARVVLIFDGRDPAALEAARENWKQAKAGGREVTYWQQAATGKWEKRA